MQRTTPFYAGLLSISLLGAMACGGSNAASTSETNPTAKSGPMNGSDHSTNGPDNTASVPYEDPTSSPPSENNGQAKSDAVPNEPRPTQDKSSANDATKAPAASSDQTGTDSASTRLKISDGSSVKWAGRKADGSGHVGGFDSIDGHAVIRGQQLERLVVKIDMTSITSDNPKLTSHLKNDDFFSVDQFPEASFFSNSVNNNATMTGELAIKGKAHEVSGPVNVEWTEDGVRVQATWNIDRTRWGVDYKSSVTGIVADKAINDEVPLTIDLNFTAN